ncbi:MAG: hypothetical protein ACKPBE_03555 [Betaproteobacteria bacterium]
MMSLERLRPLALSLIILGLIFGIWALATMGGSKGQVVDDEYAKWVGAAAASGQKSAFPTPGDFLEKLGGHLADPFYDRAPTIRALAFSWPIRSPACCLDFFLRRLLRFPWDS